jgi:dihydrofolate reductase
MRGPVALIAAVAKNGVIGHENGLPWRLKSDMLHFRRVTFGKPVLMGRKTYQSIGRPLVGRTTIVVSRDAGLTLPGALVTGSLDHALELAEGDRLRRGASEIIVAGGAELYAQTLPLAARLYLTEVDASPEGDAFFPALPEGRFRESAREALTRGPEDVCAADFVVLERA